MTASSEPVRASKRNFWAYIPVNLAQAIFAFATVALFSRRLAPAEYGRFALAATAILIGQGGVFHWLHNS